ncbi:MAG: hypothetical protein JWR19_1005 [Pedosphaera sp.]|nr:hypothetical protein [Pedosphaera sp.]
MMLPNQPYPASRHWIAALTLLAVAGGVVVLFLFNPAQHSFYPVCIFHRLTGLECPGCGASRALHSLFHGRLLAALHFNPLFVLALPFLLFVGVRMLWCEITGQPQPAIKMRAFWIKLIAATIIIFTIARNIPFAPFTYLSPP